jgi:hypothetical protein
MLSSLAETWWNSSTAISRSSNASIPSFSTAKRKVAWVQTSTWSPLSRKAPTDFTLPPSVPGELHRFHFGATVQSAQKPNLLSGSSLKLDPIDFSGTTTIACLSPWLCSLSSAMNISARLLPEAGGDLISRYCSPRFS